MDKSKLNKLKNSLKRSQKLSKSKKLTNSKLNEQMKESKLKIPSPKKFET